MPPRPQEVLIPLSSELQWTISLSRLQSSAETNMKRHNWISPTSMEALQMLKVGLKKAHLDFTAGLLTLQDEILDDNLDVKRPNSLKSWLLS